MNHWPFIAVAYALSFAAVASAIVISWRAMRAAEARAERIAGER